MARSICGQLQPSLRDALGVDHNRRLSARWDICFCGHNPLSVRVESARLRTDRGREIG